MERMEEIINGMNERNHEWNGWKKLLVEWKKEIINAH